VFVVSILLCGCPSLIKYYLYLLVPALQILIQVEGPYHYLWWDTVPPL